MLAHLLWRRLRWRGTYSRSECQPGERWCAAQVGRLAAAGDCARQRRLLCAVAACGLLGQWAQPTLGTSPCLLPSETAPSEKKRQVKVALLVPLSAQGHPGLIGKSLKQAAELALFERDNPTCS